MKKNFFFLLLCNSKVGFGHFFRCLKYSKILKKKGYQSFFLMNYSKSNLKIIKKNKIKNFQFVNYKKLNFKEKLNNKKKSILILDIYNINQKLINNYKLIFDKVGYFDDLGKSFNADFVINYFVKKNIYKYRAKEKLLGLSYAPVLKNSFTSNKKKLTWPNRQFKFENKKKVKILVTFGSTDYFNLSEQILDILYNSQYELLLAVGSYYHNKKKLITKYKKFKNIKIFYSIEGLGKLISKVDIVICAGGLTVYEALEQRKKIISIILSKNQNFSKFLTKFKIFKFFFYNNNIKFIRSKINKNLTYFLTNKFSKNDKNQFLKNLENKKIFDWAKKI